ncbi:MAG: hypothetical protein WBB25_01060 [Sulfitobacter sp.]
MNVLTAIDVRVWQAVVAGAFVAAGWLVNGWQNRRDAAALRAEKLRDYHRAIFAEIGATLANLWGDENLRSTADGIISQMRGDPEFVPFIPREHGDYVFNALVGDIHILPRRTIDPIVAYYSQIKAIAALADDMRGHAFREMSQTRRIAMYSDYVEMKEQLVQYGLFATKKIAAFAEGGNAAADKVKAPSNVAAPKRVSTPDAGPSGPSQGSA